MTTTPVEKRADLSDRVAEEIRALLARKRMSGAALARHLGVSPMWVSYRLNGRQPIDLNDLAAIARALDVSVHKLLPEGPYSESDGVTVLFPQLAERATRKRAAPPDNRPNGHPLAGVSPGNRRTDRVPRPGPATRP